MACCRDGRGMELGRRRRRARLKRILTMKIMMRRRGEGAGGTEEGGEYGGFLNEIHDE